MHALAAHPKGGLERSPAPAAMKPAKRLRLVSRAKAFSMQGIALVDPVASRSGVTRGGDVVFALWAEDVAHGAGGASCLLWAPNAGGQRPWSDSAAGQERRDHCRRALENDGAASALFVYGEKIAGVLPEDRAARVDGTDSEQLVRMRVEQRGKEFWGCWGGRTAGAEAFGI
jgi:hypothetical protein